MAEHPSVSSNIVPSSSTAAWATNAVVSSVSVMPVTANTTASIPTVNAVPVATTTSHNSVVVASSSSSVHPPPQQQQVTNSPSSITQTNRQTTLRPNTGSDPTKVLDKQRIEDLVKEVDPMEQLDDDVEELLVQIADDFIDNVVNSAAQLAKHRKAPCIEVKDVQMHLERNWNMWIPGFGATEEPRPYRKAATTEAHKQRMALIKKTLKKY